MNDDAAHYRADVRDLNPGDATTRTLDPLDGKEDTYATTRLDVARAIAARHADFAVYNVTLDEPIEAAPDAAQDNLGELFVRSPQLKIRCIDATPARTRLGDWPRQLMKATVARRMLFVSL
ncbi:MAG TPA: hypothetical protein VN255_01405 [Mycobacterium sp.]|nr:hypothetical protein [Mycobacterium sp.]